MFFVCFVSSAIINQKVEMLVLLLTFLIFTVGSDSTEYMYSYLCSLGMKSTVSTRGGRVYCCPFTRGCTAVYLVSSDAHCC